MKDFNIYFEFLQEVEAKEKNCLKMISNIFDIFSYILLIKTTQESDYLLEKLYEKNIINDEILKRKKSFYFAQYKTLDELKNDEYEPFSEQFLDNYEELSKNDWELHKQLIKEGVNPNEIAKIIRNDEIEKLQEISSRDNFNFNQIIEPSLYERCSFINQENVTLIDYAAFFGSVKCFKYLLMNGANVKNTGKYAIAGGNLEIIHLCEQNHSSFEGAYSAAIEFHRIDIMQYVHENEILDVRYIAEFGRQCIYHNNYELFTYFKDEGMEIDDSFMNEAAKNGNIFLVQYFNEEVQIPNNVLVSASKSGNLELVKYLITQKKINVNAKDIQYFYLMLISWEMDFFKIFNFHWYCLIQHL